MSSSKDKKKIFREKRKLFEKHRKETQARRKELLDNPILEDEEERRMLGKELNRDEKRLKNVTKPKSLITALDL